jgi:RNA polymerase-binding transcription factor DksA
MQQAGSFNLGDTTDDDVHEVENFIVNKDLQETYEKELRDIDSAIKRLTDGSYGICKYTGEPIGEDRLRARPTSSTSAEYKQRLQDR